MKLLVFCNLCEKFLDFARKATPVAMKIKETFEQIPGNPYGYEYHEGPGKHEWIFWDQWIQRFLDTLPLKGE